MCHSLEHIRLHQVAGYLKYLNRLLKPNSYIYISVPDFETLSSMYLAQNVVWTKLYVQFTVDKSTKEIYIT